MSEQGEPKEGTYRVLAFKSGDLRDEGGYEAAALHIYRVVRNGEKVIAKVPALRPEAGEAPAQAGLEAGQIPPASFLAGVLDRLGVRACVADTHPGEEGADERDVLDRLGLHEVALVSTSTAPVGDAAASPDREGRKLRVALLGCGAVGAGVLAYLESRPDLFELNAVLVRSSAGREAPGRFTEELEQALCGQPDLVVELLGGTDYPAKIMCAALKAGTHVVSANKAAIAKYYDELHACAGAGGARLGYSAAVGGGTPILETVARLRGEIAAVEGVMNGTSNFLLGKMGEGWSFDEAVRKAQELGFAEADPATDVDGHDAADKLSILVREAFGVALLPTAIPKQSLRDVAPERVAVALAQGEVLKQVGRCRLTVDGGVLAEVSIENLPEDHPLAGARNEENRFLITGTDGRVHQVFGKGAGRWPTAAAIFADVMDMEEALAGARGELLGADSVLRLRA